MNRTFDASSRYQPVRRITLHPEPAEKPALRPTTIDYRSRLNAEQYEAVTAGTGPWLVVAGAGTGKTRTLIHRVAYLVETGTPPEEIALLTFTRRAAGQMLDRASALLDGRCRRVRGGTFHAFGLAFLRRYAPLLDLPNSFTILDASDSGDVMDVVRTEGGFGRGDRRFPKAAVVYAIVSAAINRGLPIADIVAEQYPRFTGHIPAIEDLGRSYANYKQRCKLLDYDDLIVEVLRLFEQFPKVHRQESAALAHVLVDEYQDVNQLQARFVRRLSEMHGNLMAVGDDAQGIYRFRGADPEHLLQFPKQFEGTRVIKLEANYRSSQQILDLANHVLAKVARRTDKALRATREGGEPPVLVRAQDERRQSRFVVQMLLARREAGVPLDRIAVLFRNGWNAFDLELLLEQRGIPFVKYGGIRLSEAAHVKDVVAHLRVIENPADVAAWNRVLRLLEGVGPQSAAALLEWIGGARDPYDLDPSQPEGPSFASERFVESLRKLAEVIQFLRSADVPLSEQLGRLVAYYRPILERKYPDEVDERAEDLNALINLGDAYEDRTALLSALALEPVDKTAERAEQAYKDEKPLVLSTIHSAKGLEFDTVFVIHLLDGVLPSEYAVGRTAELDEERRLLYVAITRAESELYLSYPAVQRSARGGFFSTVSRFIQDIPEELLASAVLVDESENEHRALPPG